MDDAHRPSRLRIAAAGALVALAAVAGTPGAGMAHEGSGEYESVIRSVTPSDAPIVVSVRDGDDRLLVRNVGDEEVTILGYEDEPYLRIGPDGVFANTNSKAYYTNDDRYGDVQIPEGVGEGPPAWERQESDGPQFEFHDHRIHWMLPSPPDQVDTKDPSRQEVTDWEVPFEYAGTTGSVDGTLYYVGGSPSLVPWIAAAGGVVLVIGAIAVVVVGRRRP